MKKNFKCLLLALALIVLTLSLASCSMLEGLLPGEKDPCTHVDTDANGKCDECGEDVSAEPGDPEDEPDEPIKDMGKAPNVRGVSFKNKTVTYNGQYHELAVDKNTLPTGVVVLYSTNKYMNVGSYEVTADFYWAGEKIEGASKTATLTINKATYDMSGTTLTGLTKYYDGEAVTPKIAGRIPAGVTVNYTYKNSLGETVEQIKDADTYTVWASFTGDKNNYHEITPLSTTVEIRRARIAGISFADKRFDYDGSAKSIYIEYNGELPSEVSVSYEGNEQTEIGTYTVTAKFTTSANYEPIADISATLKITNKIHDMSGVSLRGETVTYDGRNHMPVLVGDLPAGVSAEIIVTNEAGEVVTSAIDAGVYTAVAKFTVAADYEPVPDMTATVTITKASVGGISFADATVWYDGEAKFIYVTGAPADIEVTYLGNGKTEIGSYTVTAQFNVGNNYAPIPDMTATLNIVKKAYDMSGVSLDGATVTYDGTNHMPTVSGEIPEGVIVTIIATDINGNVVSEIVNAGVYTVTAKFTVDPDFESIPDMTATVTVNKAVFTGATFEDALVYYNGEAKYIYVSGIPESVDVEYVGNGQMYPGVYTVTATLKPSDNYEAPAPMSATLTIQLGNPEDTPTTQLTYEKVEGGYAVTGLSESRDLVIIPATYEGEAVVSIKSNAFRGMTNLKYVYIPESVENIGNAAFYGCTNLATLKIADFSITVGADGNLVTTDSSALKTIGQKAFADTAITEIDLPDSLTAIGFGAFEGCSAMTKITVPFIGGSANTTHSYLAYIFGAASAEVGYNYVPSTLKTVIISDVCTEIPAFALYKLSGVESIYIGKSVEKIGNSAFAYTGIADIFVPASVKSIPASAKAENSPFYGCGDDLLIAFESVVANIGTHYASISDEKVAFTVFNKTYEDYVMNKEDYRQADPTDAYLAGIYLDGVLLEGFDKNTLSYTIDVDVNVGVGVISAMKSASIAEMVITKSASGVTITVTSYDTLTVNVYTVTYNITGTFNSSAEVVNKNGASGTVSFVIDDGYVPAANFAKEMMAKYPNLALNFAIFTRKFATLKTEDKNGDGIPEYEKDADGNYLYDIDTDTVNFWKDIINSAPGRVEIISHSHNHGFWGMNDKGGTQVTVSNRDQKAAASDELIEGGSTAQIWAAQQIVKDIFGELGSRGITYVTPGIVKHTGDKAISADYTVKFSNSAVWLINDTAVNVDGNTITLAADTAISLQSVNIVMPAGTTITTVADYSSGVIAAGSVVRIVSGSYVIPAGTTVLGYGAYYDDLYSKAFGEGVMIAARNTGAKANSSSGYYTKDYFTTEAHRLLQRSFGISVSSSTTEETVDGWVSHIDAAVSKGVWVSYCIHNILTPDTATGNYILEEHGERLFSQAASYGDQIWIANYTDATLYYHEWSSAVVTNSYNAENGTISVSLTDGERDDIYNMPLTIKVAVPANWSEVSVGGEALEIRANADGSRFVYVDVAPETTATIIGR